MKNTVLKRMFSPRFCVCSDNRHKTTQYIVQTSVSSMNVEKAYEKAYTICILLDADELKMRGPYKQKGRNSFSYNIQGSYFNNETVAYRTAIRLNRQMIALEIEELQEQLRQLDNLIV